MTLGHLHDIHREVIFPSHTFYRRETKTKTGSAFPPTSLAVVTLPSVTSRLSCDVKYLAFHGQSVLLHWCSTSRYHGSVGTLVYRGDMGYPNLQVILTILITKGIWHDLPLILDIHYRCRRVFLILCGLVPHWKTNVLSNHDTMSCWRWSV